MSFTGSAGPVPDPNPAAWHRVETTAMGLRVFDLYDERGHIVSIHWRGPEHSVTVHLARTGEVGTNPWGEPVKGWLMDGVQEIEHDGDDPVTVLRYTPDSRL